MSLKAVELQIALPKTFEAGKQSEALQQQSLLQAEMAKSEMERKLQRDRNTVTTTLASEKTGRDRNKNEDGSGHDEKGSDHHNLHPFKGNMIDFMG